MPDKPSVTNDAIVSYADAERWVRELYAMPFGEIEARLVQVEPALVGVAMDLAGRVQRRLGKRDLDEVTAAEVAAEMVRAGAICAELARRGYQQFIRNTDNNEEGAT